MLQIVNSSTISFLLVLYNVHLAGPDDADGYISINGGVSFESIYDMFEDEHDDCQKFDEN